MPETPFQETLATLTAGDHHEVMPSPQRPGRPSRRELLRFQDRSEGRSPEGVGLAADIGEHLLLEIGRPAMGCRFDVLLHSCASAESVEAALESLDLVEHLEDRLSLYRPASDVCRLNASAAERPVALDESLWPLLRYGEDLHRSSHGAFDITTTPLSRLWGFHRREGRLPSEAEIKETLSRVGMQHVLLDAQHRTVRFARPGIEVSFAAIGKGYALDQAAALLSSSGIDHFLLHGGYSSILARGSQPPSSTGESLDGWPIALRDPFRPERRLGRVILRNESLGTSGIANQSFIHHGKRYGHILDPRSGYPASELVSVTVVSPLAMHADALSTAFFVMGHDAVVAYCQRHGDCGVIMVSRAESGPLAVDVIGLDRQWLPDD